jgi:hypothetical protein
MAVLNAGFSSTAAIDMGAAAVGWLVTTGKSTISKAAMPATGKSNCTPGEAVG